MKYNFKILLSQYVAKHQELLFIFDLVCLQTNQWVFRDPGFALPNSGIPGLSGFGSPYHGSPRKNEEGYSGL